MVARLVTASVAAPVLLAVLWFGNPWLAGLAALAAIIGVWEFYRLFRSDDALLPVWLGVLWVWAFVAAGMAADGFADFLKITLGVAAGGAFAGYLWLIGGYRGRKQYVAAFYLLAGPLCLGLFLAHAVALRDFGGGGELGRGWLILAVLVTFATDTGAFFVGRSLGRHSLAPVISPNKTWEGAVGGFVLAILAALAVGTVIDLGVARWEQALAGAVVGIAAQLGDLLESKLKRISQVKDTGSIMPGHGGLLDRVDSLALAVPAAYYCLNTVFKP